VDFKLKEMAEASVPGESHTLQEIADYVGISRERVRQIEEKALMRLRRKLTHMVKEDKLDIEEFQR
jgi:DNA-directed RNA polymerase sigma subunit (sigma70/sigma32)